MLKIKKQISVTIICLFLISLLSNSAFASNLGSLTYWYSSESTIGRWTSTPYINSTKLNTTSSFYYSTAVSSARTQWNSALGISMTLTSSSTAGIFYYGGTTSELNALGIWSTITTDNGVTKYTSRAVEGTYTWGTVSKTGYTHSKIHCCIVDKSRTSDEYKKTATHELGHALGWHGHDTAYSTSVMHTTGHSTYTLNSRDKYHLSQVY